MDEEYVFCGECDECLRCTDAQRMDGCEFGIRVTTNEDEEKKNGECDQASSKK